METYIEEPPSRVKRTVIDGIKNVKLRRSKDLWNNKRLASFIDLNTSVGKKADL
jgi:hypothetical protein